MIGRKWKEVCIRSESCAVPWKEVKYFSYNLCQKEKILFSTFFLGLSFPFDYFHVVRGLKPVLALLARKCTSLQHTGSRTLTVSPETALKSVADSSLAQLTFAPPSQIFWGGEQAGVMSCFLLKLCPILVLYLYPVAAVSDLGPNTSQPGASGNKSMCFSKQIKEITAPRSLHA